MTQRRITRQNVQDAINYADDIAREVDGKTFKARKKMDYRTLRVVFIQRKAGAPKIVKTAYWEDRL